MTIREQADRPGTRGKRCGCGIGIIITPPDRGGIRTGTAEIIEMMVPFFREEDYYQGLRTGFEQIIADNEGVAWEVAYFTLEDARGAGEQAVGKIVSFEAEITTLEEEVPPARAMTTFITGGKFQSICSAISYR